VDFVNLFGGRWLAVGLGAVVLARLATGFLGLADGLSLGERSSLALAGAKGLIELTTQSLVLGLQDVDATLKDLAAGTGDGLHTPL
jgi:hypothetical protein